MNRPKTDIDALFGEAWDDADFRFNIKAQSVATDLARAVAESGQTRTALAERLGWKPSRLSKILGGDANLTLRTLHELTEALGMAFDVILRHSSHALPQTHGRSPQPVVPSPDAPPSTAHAHPRPQSPGTTPRRHLPAARTRRSAP